MNSAMTRWASTLFAGVSAFSSFGQVALVHHEDAWRWHKGNAALQTGWKTLPDASLDSTWFTSAGGFGYSTDNTNETNLCRTVLADMRNSYSTFYMRRQFSIASAVDTNLHLFLTMDFDDGFMAWLDGVHLTNSNVTGAPTEPRTNAVASASHESSRGNAGSNPQPPAFYDLGPVGSRLGVGTHTLAIVGLNQALNSSDFIQIADLTLGGSGCPPDSICEDTHWTTAGSPYVIPSTMTIAAGATLTIDPGVIVRLAPGASLIVADGGRLVAEGTSNAPIRFTRSGNSGSWGHFLINGSVGSPESRIAYAHFELNSSSPTIEVAAGTAYLDHLTFGNAGISYIHVDGASFIISHCHFPDGTAGFELVHGTGGIKSGGHGVFYRNFFGKTQGYNDVVDFSGGNRPGPIVQFFENVFTGSDDDGLDLDSTDAWVEGNIFLHIHKNGAPDSSSGVSGGSDNARNSEITILRNIFYDCDHAATAKQTNFYTLFNNTIVHLTHEGGLDTASAVVNVRDFPDSGSPTSFGRGFYLEGNIVFDTESLVRNYEAGETSVVFSNNILPSAWPNGGGGNLIANPMLKHVPTLGETVFTNWSQAQILWDWFSLRPGSPALGTGPNGTDKGAVIPMGASISGEPASPTTNTSAALRVGFNRTGNGIPTGGFPGGSGYVSYKWRLDGGAWSAETPINNAINLMNLAAGSHHVEVSGKRDTGLFQDDPLLGDEALVSRSRDWVVQTATALRIDGITFAAPNTVQIRFIAQPNTGYTIYSRDSLSVGAWQPLVHLDPLPSTHTVVFPDSIPSGRPMRYYRISTP